MLQNDVVQQHRQQLRGEVLAEYYPYDSPPELETLQYVTKMVGDIGELAFFEIALQEEQADRVGHSIQHS